MQVQSQQRYLLKRASAQAEWPRAIEELVSFPHIEEAGVLSTCNRLELYVVALSWHRVSACTLYWGKEMEHPAFQLVASLLPSQLTLGVLHRA